MPDALRVSSVLAFRSHKWFLANLAIRIVGHACLADPGCSRLRTGKIKGKTAREFVASLQTLCICRIFGCIHSCYFSNPLFGLCWCMMLWWWLILLSGGIAALFFWEQAKMVLYQEKH